MNAVYNQSDITFMVLDNRWTAMTGHQPNPSTGFNAFGEEWPRADIPGIVKSMGVEFVEECDAYDHEKAVDTIYRALEHKGPAVVIMTGECQLQKQRRIKKGLATTYVNALHATAAGHAAESDVLHLSLTQRARNPVLTAFFAWTAASVRRSALRKQYE